MSLAYSNKRVLYTGIVPFYYMRSTYYKLITNWFITIYKFAISLLFLKIPQYKYYNYSVYCWIVCNLTFYVPYVEGQLHLILHYEFNFII